ncbi:uncharacterized protein LOC129002661 [Macrosteles quadrilineatus]|uniref:uncharacterized protein LOC129002661 n=1 Tax=Macrosteles quadrilineatus TaxID=74068 RepID=UPI0023E1798F|nr:uncharacterized protein LOC129002661 [Macrosteles quadrilineatus]
MEGYYNSNQNNSSMAQNYRYRQNHQYQMPSKPNTRQPQGGGFSANTFRPSYNQAPSNPTNYSSRQQAQTFDYPKQYNDEKPPPSYEESQRDKLLRRSNASNPYEMNLAAQSSSNRITSLFDIPDQAKEFGRPPEWPRGDTNFSNSYQQGHQERMNPSTDFSQQPSLAFSSGERGGSTYNSSTRNQRGFNQSNPNWKQESGESSRHENSFQRERSKQNQGDFNNWEGKPTAWQMDECGESHFEKTNQLTSSSRHEDSDNDNSEYVNYNNPFQGSDNEGNDNTHGSFGDLKLPNKVNLFLPDPSLVSKFEYYPPSPEEMGEMFKDLVIHFFFKASKNKNKKENPFVVICEAFRRSTSYANIDIEDGYDMQYKNRKFCTMRYHRMMLVRGVGENNNLKEPRIAGAVELINQLAMSCYTLESKPSYFSDQALERMIKVGSVIGLYTIVPTRQIHNFEAACKYFEDIQSSWEESDVEYLFQMKDAQRLKSLATRTGKFDARMIKGDQWVGVCRHRTPQYWRDKMLASGTMENERFILKPPQGIGNLLIENLNITDYIHNLRTLPNPSRGALQNRYGPDGFGPNISKAVAPWERRFGPGKNFRKKEKLIAKQLRTGVAISNTKGFKFLSKKQKQKLKKRFGN